MFSLKKGQLILIIATILVMVGLLSLDLKPPQTKNAKGGRENTQQEQSQISLEDESREAKATLDDSQKARISELEKALENNEGSKASQLKDIAQAYTSLSKFGAAAMYYKELISVDPSTENYIQAGDAFRTAYRNEDSTKTPFFAQNAIEFYQKALEKDADNLDAKTGLGICYVDASQNPMQGIQLLLEVVKQDPENVNANLNLGLFSMKSGQYDKAINRFETVAKTRPSAEVYVYLAEAHEKSGNKSEAANALEKAKEYIIDPNVLRGIDEYIKTLK
jgi:tetratricopeptide (TPR) repeat protein